MTMSLVLEQAVAHMNLLVGVNFDFTSCGQQSSSWVKTGEVAGCSFHEKALTQQANQRRNTKHKLQPVAEQRVGTGRLKVANVANYSKMKLFHNH